MPLTPKVRKATGAFSTICPLGVSQVTTQRELEARFNGFKILWLILALYTKH